MQYHAKKKTQTNRNIVLYQLQGNQYFMMKYLKSGIFPRFLSGSYRNDPS